MTSPPISIALALNKLTLPSGNVMGIGVDLVNVGMLEELLASGHSAFLDRGWTDAEQRDAEHSPERLASRWAAKEAVMKALRRGLGDVDPLDIEVTHCVNGAPTVRLQGSAAEAAEQAGAGDLHVSMSHQDGWAVAFAVAAPRSSDGCSEAIQQEIKGESHDE